MAHALPEIAVAAAEAEQLGQLRARQEQRDAALEADEHRFGEEVDDGAGARGVRREGQRRDHQRRARGEARPGGPGRRPTSRPASRRSSSEIAEVTVTAVCRELQNSQNTSPPNRHA